MTQKSPKQDKRMESIDDSNVELMTICLIGLIFSHFYSLLSKRNEISRQIKKTFNRKYQQFL